MIKTPENTVRIQKSYKTIEFVVKTVNRLVFSFIVEISSESDAIHEYKSVFFVSCRSIEKDGRRKSYRTICCTRHEVISNKSLTVMNAIHFNASLFFSVSHPKQ